MKIVNVSDKPFEFMFSEVTYGPYVPGQIIDLPDHIAQHGLDKSAILDDEGLGNIVGFKLKTLADAKVTEKNILIYECPLVASGECTAKAFSSLDDLKAHMETHWGSALKPVAGKQGQPQKGLADL